MVLALECLGLWIVRCSYLKYTCVCNFLYEMSYIPGKNSWVTYRSSSSYMHHGNQNFIITKKFSLSWQSLPVLTQIAILTLRAEHFCNLVFRVSSLPHSFLVIAYITVCCMKIQVDNLVSIIPIFFLLKHFRLFRFQRNMEGHVKCLWYRKLTKSLHG